MLYHLPVPFRFVVSLLLCSINDMRSYQFFFIERYQPFIGIQINILGDGKSHVYNYKENKN